MRRKTCIISAILLVALMVSGCGKEKSHFYTMSNNDKIAITYDTSDKFDVSSNVPFVISCDGKELSEGTFMALDAYYTELDAATYDTESFSIIDSGADDDIEYTFYSDGEQYNYLIYIKDSNTSVMLKNDISEDSAKECFDHLKFTLK